MTSLRSQNSYRFYHVNPEINPPGYPPLIMRMQDVLYYLSTNINRFNKYYRPLLTEIPMGEHGVGFYRPQIEKLAMQIANFEIDFDGSLKNNMGRGGKRPNIGETSWDVNARQDFTNVKVSGISTSKSSDEEFAKVLKQARSKRLRSI